MIALFAGIDDRIAAVRLGAVGAAGVRGRVRIPRSVVALLGRHHDGIAAHRGDAPLDLAEMTAPVTVLLVAVIARFAAVQRMVAAGASTGKTLPLCQLLACRRRRLRLADEPCAQCALEAAARRNGQR